MLVTTAAGFGLLQTIRVSLYTYVGTMRSSANAILFFLCIDVHLAHPLFFFLAMVDPVFEQH